MCGVEYEGPHQVAVENVPDPTSQQAHDAIVPITTTNICESDLHMYEGRADVDEGEVLGHENIGPWWGPLAESAPTAWCGSSDGRRTSRRATCALSIFTRGSADDAAGHERFDQREDGWTKVLLHPAA